MYDVLVKGRDHDDAAALEAHKEKYGNFNAAPENFREITAEEFASGKFFIYGFEKVEYRQIAAKHIPGEEYNLAVKLFFFYDGTGVGMAAERDLGIPKGVRYFAFGCKHTWRELSVEAAKAEGVTHFGNCYHVIKCSTCNRVEAYDSSG